MWQIDGLSTWGGCGLSQTCKYHAENHWFDSDCLDNGGISRTSVRSHVWVSYRTLLDFAGHCPRFCSRVERNTSGRINCHGVTTTGGLSLTSTGRDPMVRNSSSPTS